MYVRSHIARHLPDEDLDYFALWAFGDTYKLVKEPKEFVPLWNALHGDKLYLSASGKISEDTEKMAQLYKER